MVGSCHPLRKCPSAQGHRTGITRRFRCLAARVLPLGWATLVHMVHCARGSADGTCGGNSGRARSYTHACLRGTACGTNACSNLDRRTLATTTRHVHIFHDVATGSHLVCHLSLRHLLLHRWCCASASTRRCVAGVARYFLGHRHAGIALDHQWWSERVRACVV